MTIYLGRITAPNLTLIRGEGRGIAEEGSISAGKYLATTLYTRHNYILTITLYKTPVPALALLAVKAALETDIWSLVQR